MSTSFSRRFVTLVEQLTDGNKKRFAELTGRSPSTIYRICRGGSRPSLAYLEHLYETFNIDLNWLITGERNVEQLDHKQTSDLVIAPKFDVEASAGFGQVGFAEEVSEHFGFSRQWLASQLGVHTDKVAFVSVKGDSMQPTLEDGDMILVDMSYQQVHKEGVYLLYTEDGLMTKRLKPIKGGIKVVSDNPEYPSWEILASTQEQARVVGKIVWFG
ncbi:LexA family transcriptional repressor, partial [Alteromonadales bacterium alter-6D02]